MKVLEMKQDLPTVLRDVNSCLKKLYQICAISGTVQQVELVEHY